MWRSVALPLILGALAAAACAQETPRVEVTAAGSYAREAIANLRHVNGVGWNGSVFENVNSWFGAGIDISGYFSSPKVNLGLPSPTSSSARSFMYLFGPRFSRRGGIHLKPYAEALVGVDNLRLNPKAVGVNRTVSLTSFAGAFGGGLDVPINGRLALRLIEADYVLTRFRKFDATTGAFDGPHQMQNNIRASAGIVFSFGQR